MAIRNWGTLALAGLAVACGGDEGASYDSLVAAIESPTGTVDATTTPTVIEKFDTAYGSGAGSTAFATGDSAVTKQSSVDYGSLICDAGGDASLSGDESGGTITYADCCIGGGYYGEADVDACCLTGKQTYFVGSGGSYSQCMSFSLTTTCGGESVTSDFDGCFGSDGSIIYSIEVEGETFAVSASGSYYEGTGTLEVTGQNGSFTCTLQNYEGSCEGSGGSFTL